MTASTAATAIPTPVLTPQAPAEGGLLLSELDPWGDAGLLHLPTATAAEPSEPQSLRSFIAEAYPRYGFHRWAEVLIDLLQQVADGHLGRLIVTCPPRLGKSLLVSKLFPAYFLQRYPHLFAAIASYSAELAYAHSREARHFYRVTGHLLARDSAAVGNWLTRQRGGCIAAGVDGPFTGKGYSLGIIDDPYKGPGDAASPALRQKLIDWLRSVWLTRAEPASVLGPDGSEQPNLSAQVVVLTRWDHQDVIGWLLEQELGEAPQNWTILDLPAIAEEPGERPQLPSTCTLIPDWRQAGEALCPERFPLPELLKIRARLGAYWWAALYQQRPSPASGSIFLRQWIRPPFPREEGNQRQYALLALSCDLSFKGEAESDYCGFCLAGLLAPPARSAIPRTGEPQGPSGPKELEIEVLWSARHRFGLPEVIRFLLGCLQALEQQGLRPNAVLIEDAANGPAVLQTLRRRVPGMLPITARGSKETRAHAVAPLLEAGQIRFHHRAQPLVEEAIRFPKGSKDLVDAFCHGALWLEGRYWKAQGIQPVVTPLLVSR
ncbi:terminase [Synechococcus sp. CBW1004]|uniref:phage terminase large subunit family protein n=1 Tax=Synechococcus sp. CBW1004 TaxID=1353136 RepID=UPI0018CD0DE0|nr:terminase [Synechococcus sp. CBW1004]QPN63649.1 terminase [Synechococcus sp. CBW1004]